MTGVVSISQIDKSQYAKLTEAYGPIIYNIYMAYGSFNILNIKSTVLFFIAELIDYLISSICNYNCRICNTAKI